MNQRMMKFTLELQNANEPEKKPKYISFKNGRGEKNLFSFFKAAFVTVPFNK